MAFRMILLVLVILGTFDSSSSNKLSIVTRALRYNSGYADVETDGTFYTGSSSVIRSEAVRSMLDCIDSCLLQTVEPPCLASLYRAEEKDCLLLDSSYGNQELSDMTGDERSGKLLSFSLVELDDSTGTSDLCASVTCAANARCYVFADVDHPDHPYPYCIGENKDCDLEEEYTNIQHYYGNRYTDETDDGVFQRVTYNKTREDSYIRVNYNNNFLGHFQITAQCKRFFVTFDGNECSSPGPIDWVTYSYNTGDMRRAATIDGTCFNIGTGIINVELRIGACDGYGANDGLVGWNNNRQLLVMEIVPRNGHATAPCPGLSVFNYAYTSYSSSTGQHGSGTTVFTADTYNKAAEDTNLRIRWQATLRSEQISNVEYCSRWAIFIDGTECSPQGDVIIHPTTHGSYDYHRNMLKGHTLEAICENIDPGEHDITIKTTQCHYTKTEPAYYHTGWKSYMRMHIEEVRQSARMDAVLTRDRRIIRNPFQNVYRQHYWLLNNGEDSGEIRSFTYTKNNAYTSLRLTSSGDHRTIYEPGTSYAACSRWYFKIDGNECSNPGPIEGIYYFNYETNFHHPMQVSGVCYGVTAGEHQISYYVGACATYTEYGQAYTGWGSSFHLFAEEVNLEETRTCTDGRPMICD